MSSFILIFLFKLLGPVANLRQGGKDIWTSDRDAIDDEKSVWEEFFDAHAPIYEENVFTKHTIQEVNSLQRNWAVRDGAQFLMLEAVQDRHSIELARRGYAVTGLDLSQRCLPGLRMLPGAKK